MIELKRCPTGQVVGVVFEVQSKPVLELKRSPGLQIVGVGVDGVISSGLGIDLLEDPLLLPQPLVDPTIEIVSVSIPSPFLYFTE